MIIKCMPIGFIAANCYLLIDEKSGEAAVVDPGRYTEALENLLKENGVSSLKYILATHGHYDHIMGIPELKEHFGGQVFIHGEDEICLEKAEYAGARSATARRFVPSEADGLLHDGDELRLGETVIKVMHTPGHTRGGVCYIFDDVIITGDTVFKGTVGRTDFEFGDMSALMDSVKKLCALEGDYKILPGHDEATTLENERRYNPYFSDFS